VQGVRAPTALAGVRALPPRVQEPAPPPLPRGFALDAPARRIRVGPGSVRYDGVLRLPDGFALDVAPGTELLAGPAAVLEVHGDLDLRGTPTAPIVVRGASDETWGAFAVVGDPERRARVRGSYTTFRGGTGSNEGSTRYTGAVAIYFADVRLDHFGVEDNQSEDALNVKYSTVHMTDNHFRGGSSDAVDYDFVSGLDLRTRIDDFGNDGIDASGSNLRIEGARIHGARDKGLSLGEASTPVVRDVQVSGARIGCAVKDRADADVLGLSVARSRTAVALYTKKPSYGPSRALFRELVAVDVGAFAILDHRADARFEDVVRLGPAEPPMRAFAGVRNVVLPGLAELPGEALFAEAERTRAAVQAASDSTARVTARD
jgi:hypothetical protein